MDIGKAYSEPFVRLVEFHDAFNRSIKLCSASIAFVGRMAGLPEAGKPLSEIILRADVEPWGRSPWKSIEDAAPQAKSFVAELGIVRAVSAFEDYVTRAWGELDRVEGSTTPVETAADVERPKDEEACLSETGLAHGRLFARLGFKADQSVLSVAAFMSIARNCIVHRSNRASAGLFKARYSAELETALASWAKRKNAKWKVSLPDIAKGEPVLWLPRHALAASDCFYRLSKEIDKAVVDRLGSRGMVLMATHWALLADAAFSPAKLNTETVVRTQLHQRYGVKSADTNEIIGLLRESGKWKDALAAFERRHPKPARKKLRR